MTGTGRRLARLEARLAPPACPACRDWEISFALGDDQGRWSRPEGCPSCGRVVPRRRAAIIVGIDLNWL